MSKTIIVILIGLIVFLQSQLWFGKGSIPELYDLHLTINNQTQENALLKKRNLTLASNIRDLKNGTEGLEELARGKLGMIKKGESFYMIINRK